MIPSELSRLTKEIASLDVLIYDDDENYRKLLHSLIEQSQNIEFYIREAANTKEMEAGLNNHPPDIVVLDLALQGKSGMEWLRDIAGKKIAPVIIITGSGDECSAVEAMKNGASDYIPKAYLTYDQLIKSLVHAREKWNLLKEKEELQEKMAHMVMYDTLTNVLSRRALLEQIEFEMHRTVRYKRDLTILMIDIDHFKVVNDTYGHIVGDAVLRDIAQSLQTHTRRSDFVGRYGGEEFVVVLPETGLGKALVLAEKLRAQVEKLSVQCDGHTVKGTTISIGVADYDKDVDSDSLIGRSDKRLYEAKANGRNQVQPSRAH
jgi:two-component system cell cycle response regulator